MDKIRKIIISSIKEIGNLDIDITDDMSLFEDLEFDSVQIIELVLRIEEEFNFDFEKYDELMEHMETINDFIVYFEKYIMNIRRK